jgi:hypothetical protein
MCLDREPEDATLLFNVRSNRQAARHIDAVGAFNHAHSAVHVKLPVLEPIDADLNQYILDNASGSVFLPDAQKVPVWRAELYSRKHHESRSSSCGCYLFTPSGRVVICDGNAVEAGIAGCLHDVGWLPKIRLVCLTRAVVNQMFDVARRAQSESWREP